MSRKRLLWRKKLLQLTQEKCEGATMCKHTFHQKRYAHRYQHLPDEEVLKLALESVFPAKIKQRKRKLLIKQFGGDNK